MSRSKVKNLAFWGAVLILLVIFVFSGLQFLESAFFYQQEEAPIDSKTIERDGIRYFPRQDITMVLVLGIGEWGEAKPVEWNTACAVDMINLMIFDEKEKTVTILSVNRDTMLWMPKYTMEGKEQGKAYRQLTYSHKFCTGMEDSCENVKRAVSEFLGEISIDYYVSMRLDAIAIMNDAVGGVPVTVVDDFSAVDPSLPMGEHRLMGEQAVTYVQDRFYVGDELNITRMERHKEYMNSFMNELRRKVGESDTFALKTYEEISPYIVTDCSGTVLSSLMQRYADYTVAGFVSPEGENVLGEKYYEFYPDEEKLDELILRLFYAPK